MGRYSLMLIALLATLHSAQAAGTCETKTKPCTDARTGEMRTCTTTTCYDESGKEISSTTVVAKQGEASTAKPGTGKPAIKDIPIVKPVDKSSATLQ